MNALVRANRIDWLKGDSNAGEGECRILSNARCLSEGVDVPALDAVIFLDTRDSIVDIIQSVGRVMRKARGKEYGYIILPVCIPARKTPDYNEYVANDPQFQGIWKVIKALRSHDETLVDRSKFQQKIQVMAPEEDAGGLAEQQLDLPLLPLEDITRAVYNVVPDKLGDREYWSEWARNTANIAEHLIARITDLTTASPSAAKQFDRFVRGLQETLNPAVTRDQAVEMLAQHILTVPVFESLFADANFPESNPVGKALQRMVKQLDSAAIRSETEGLQQFYAQVKSRVAIAQSDDSRQELIRRLYDTFFHTAFPNMASRLGIVYTPVPVVDFIIKSADAALRKHFDARLSDPDVQILDPFAGTGTFLVRLLQSGLLPPETLPAKYAKELHANEIVLLAYYIATINIETAYHAATGSQASFAGMVLTDTFQMTEEGEPDFFVLQENNERAERQRKQPIRVIFGNPPYSAHQRSENDNIKRLSYPSLDERIRTTYAACSSAQLVKNLYDSYIRAVRWASDRLHDQRGIIAFVTNASFIDGNNMDGLRKCMIEEYSDLYIFNLRGNARTSGEQARKEGGVIFESSRVPAAITIMVKDPDHQGTGQIHYRDIGDYLTREDKMQTIQNCGEKIQESSDIDIPEMQWQPIRPNAAGDWINQRDPDFEKFTLLGSKEKDSDQLIFSGYSQGIVTARDAWAYNTDKQALAANMQRLITNYNTETRKYAAACAGKTRAERPDMETIVSADVKYIDWTANLKKSAAAGNPMSFDAGKIRTALYRPFSKTHFYYDRHLNERIYRIPYVFPTSEHENIVISATGRGAIKPFSALVSNITPDYSVNPAGWCFPLYWYEKATSVAKSASALRLARPHQSQPAADATPDAHGYIRRDTITDWASHKFQTHYNDTTITKPDIFWYIYAILHSPEYRTRFAGSLKRMLPRIPLTKSRADFQTFTKAGHRLGQLHLNYETAQPCPDITEESKHLSLSEQDYRVRKMTFGKAKLQQGQTRAGKDKSTIRYNDILTLRNIPLAAYDYIVNGKSAIEWIMERYAITTHKESQILNDPNQWSDNPRYIIDLLKRVTTVSLETVQIINSLPPLNEHPENK